MKKTVLVALMLAAFGGVAFGEMDDKVFNVSVIATATNSASYVLRGELQGVHVDVPAGATGTVTVASSQMTLFTKSAIAADAYFPVRIPVYSTAGAALTVVDAGSNTNAVVDRAAMAGAITATVIGTGTATNAYKVTLIYKK